MKHIKPGRGPSMMNGFIGIFMIGFGIFWTVLAAQAGGMFIFFGLMWTGIALVMTIYHFKNAFSKKRYSIIDVTDHTEEPDPLNERFGVQLDDNKKDDDDLDNSYCPFCGSKVDGEYKYCNKCGKELP